MHLNIPFVKNYKLSIVHPKKEWYMGIFWITFEWSKLQSCGFHIWREDSMEHLFTSGEFFKKGFGNGFSWGSLENYDVFLKTAIEVYWFYCIFGISIENWVDRYMFRIFSRMFFFAEKFSPGSPLAHGKKWGQSKSQLDSRKQVRTL